MTHGTFPSYNDTSASRASILSFSGTAPVPKPWCDHSLQGRRGGGARGATLIPATTRSDEEPN